MRSFVFRSDFDTELVDSEELCRRHFFVGGPQLLWLAFGRKEVVLCRYSFVWRITDGRFPQKCADFVDLCYGWDRSDRFD